MGRFLFVSGRGGVNPDKLYAILRIECNPERIYIRKQAFEYEPCILR